MQELWESEPIIQRILRTAGTLPINTRSAKVVSSNYYWIKLLEDRGLHVFDRKVDARQLYRYVTTTSSIDEALAAACSDSATVIVEELRRHTANFSAVQCGALAKDSTMLTTLVPELNSTTQVCAVLSHPTISLEYKQLLVPLLDPAQISQCLPSITDTHVLTMLDAQNIVLPMASILLAEAPNSITHWLNNDPPSTETITEWVVAAIKRGYDDNLRLLITHLATAEDNLLGLALQSRNPYAVALLVTPATHHAALITAIKNGDLQSVEVLSSQVTRQHLVVAQTAGQTAIYNYLRRRLH